jgi:aspartyl-tRNA(Asn)/glutamyl-tRNA(Gln) amidotransferase subunit A
MLEQLAADLQSGRTTSRALVEDCLARIEDPAGEGGRVFVQVDAALARTMADHADRLRQAGAGGRYGGIPISVKDLFDIAGQRSTAGSRVLADALPASQDAPAIARLRGAGFLPIGRTNMTEFAFSGLGLNPHFGTPLNPYDRATGRIPGGSSSGAAVSVTDGMAYGGIGTDTGGSCRIPAAFCGIVGFKPTARRVPCKGAVPLSTTLDSVGPLAASVGDCALLDALMACDDPTPLPSAGLAASRLRGLRIVAPRNVVLDGIDGQVARAFAAALRLLADAGAQVDEIRVAELDDIARINSRGGFSAAEAYAWHRPLIEAKSALYDPRVLIRLLRGREQEAADYIDLLAARADAIHRLALVTDAYDVMAMPTVPIVAPPLAELADDAAYGRTNILALRNPTVANFHDRCAISLPCHQAGDAPVGLMLMGAHGADRRLLAIADAVANVVSPNIR